MTLEAALCKRLAANVAGLDYDPAGLNGTLFVATMPSSPDEAVAVMPSGGPPNLTRMAVDRRSVQILVRGPIGDPRPGLVTARAVYADLDGLDLTTLDSGGADEVFVHSVTAQQSDPIPLGQDELGRYEWSLNFAVVLPVPTTNRT